VQDVLLKTDSPAWKEFSMKPSIKFILRGLVGLAAGHPQTQVPTYRQTDRLKLNEFVFWLSPYDYLLQYWS
jgi:hypothetical protein